MTTLSKSPHRSSLLENAPEHLKLIGLIAVASAQLDRTLCRLLAPMSDLDLPAARALLLTPTSNALRCQILSNVAMRRPLSHESMRDLETCLTTVKRCANRRDEMANNCYGIGREGLVVSPVNDECGEIMPITRKHLQQLADDITDCTAELDQLALTIRLDEELRQYSPAEDASSIEVSPLN